MREFGIPGTLVSVLELTMQSTLACDKIQTKMGHFFEVNHGLKQGDGDGSPPF
jgi:hypothetical protein